jgi:hypothetical protein
VTTIDAGALSTAVRFMSGESPLAVLEGFTVQNGAGGTPGGDAGGIHILNSSPTVRGNRIRNNSGGAGGLYVINSSATIENNVIESNSGGFYAGGIEISGTGVARVLGNTIADNGGIGVQTSFASPIVQGNTIVSNHGGSFGGGLRLGGAASAQILDNLIENNTADYGSGMEMFAAGTPTLRGNIFRNNGATGGFQAQEGGGIELVNFSDASIVQNLFVGNRGRQGGAIFWLVPSGARGPLLINNAIVNNDGLFGSGLFADGFDRDALVQNNVIVANPGQAAVYCGNFNDLNIPIFRNNDVFSASGPEYDGIAPDQTGLEGNISADPLFVDPAGDFHLRVGSPCVDAGLAHADLPATDPDGDPRVLDGNLDGIPVVDIGWDELVRPTAVQVSVVTSEASPGRVRVVWRVTLDPDAHATIYRQEEGLGWQPLRSAVADGSGSVELEDSEVRAGMRYGYRIGVRRAAQESFHGEVWVTVPASARLALAGFSPNPAARDGAIAFSLAGPEPAWLELFDVTGRRVLERRVDGLGAGAHVLPLRDAGALTPGVYLVRLTQGGRSMLAKGALLK